MNGKVCRMPNGNIIAWSSACSYALSETDNRSCSSPSLEVYAKIEVFVVPNGDIIERNAKSRCRHLLAYPRKELALVSSWSSVISSFHE